MLEQYCSLGDSATDDDAKTMAAGRTSTGHLIQVSLRVEEPLATATVRIDGGVEVVEEHDYAVVAAHGDSLLIRVGFKEKQHQQGYTTDYFVYNAGDAAATDPPRPPSLSLLPPCYEEAEPEKRVRGRRLGPDALGLLRRGEDELVVAELRTPRPVPELCLFRSGEWSVKRVPISYSDVDRDAGDALWEQIPSVWNTVVVPIGDRLGGYSAGCTCRAASW
jgi:hypothetical protein